VSDIGENKSGDEWAKATFVLTMICAALFVAAAVIFVLRVE